MKRIFITLSLITALAACKLPSYTIGMSETEFKAKHKWSAEVVEQTVDHAVYKVQISAMNEKRKRYQYFYFDNGKLVRLDEGQAIFGS